MSAPKVGVLSRSFSRHAILRAEAAARYADIRFTDGDATLTGAALIDFLKDRDHAIVALEAITADLLDALPGLRVVSKYGVGCDNIDLAACAARGVKVGWTGGVNRRSVAELTVGFMIALVHKVGPAMALVRDGGWKQVVGRQLSDRTVGLIGLGHVGKEVVRLLRPFGCRVLAADIQDVSAFAMEHDVEVVGRGELFERCDVVSLHVPLTPATRRMVDAAALAKLPAGAVLVNAARGGIVDEAALLDALTSGRLAGAAIDVLEVEPPTDLALAKLPTVLVTPHIGGSAEEAILAMGRAALAGLESAADPMAVVPPYLRQPA